MKIGNSNNFSWGESLDSYIESMTWGHGFYGEKFWEEEERWIADNCCAEYSLDVACGLFRELNTLKKITTKELVGLDYSEQFIEYLEREKAKTDAPKIEFVRGDSADIPFSDNYFDLSMILFGSLGIMPQVRETIVSMANKTKASGKIIVSVWMDSEFATDFRMKSYSSNFKKLVSIEKDNESGLEYITVLNNEELFFKSAIISKDFIFSLIKDIYPNAQIKSHDMEYCRIFEVQNFKS